MQWTIYSCTIVNATLSSSGRAYSATDYTLHGGGWLAGGPYSYHGAGSCAVLWVINVSQEEIRYDYHIKPFFNTLIYYREAKQQWDNPITKWKECHACCPYVSQLTVTAVSCEILLILFSVADLFFLLSMENRRFWKSKNNSRYS